MPGAVVFRMKQIITPTGSDLACRLFPFEVAGKKVELTNLANLTKL